MFRSADLFFITKADLINYFDFDIEKAIEETRKLNPKVDVMVISTKQEETLQDWINLIKMKVNLRKKGGVFGKGKNI
jgi:hydrogenase nickel incorporation protein HypB